MTTKRVHASPTGQATDDHSPVNAADNYSPLETPVLGDADIIVPQTTSADTTEIPQTLASFIQNDAAMRLQYGLVDAVTNLTQSLMASTFDASLKTKAGKVAIEMSDDIVRLTTRSNYHAIGLAYQGGLIQILMKKALRKVTKTKSGKERASIAEFKAWRDALVDAYVRGKLNIPIGQSIPSASKCTYYMLFNSKVRQLQKYMSLAECGTAILKYGYCGIDAALEIRYLIRDMEEIANPDQKPSITPAMVMTKLAEIEARLPFPEPDVLAGKQTVKAVRVHVDSLCTYFRLGHATGSEAYVTFAKAKEYALATGLSLDKKQAEKAAAHIADKPDSEKQEALKAWLVGEAKRLTEKSDSDEPAKMTAERILDFLAKIKRWKSEVQFEADTYTKLGIEEGVKTTIDVAREVVNALHEAVHGTDASTVGQSEGGVA